MGQKDLTKADVRNKHAREGASASEKLMRPPELDAALQHHEKPKALIANRLPAKPADESKLLPESLDDDDDSLARIDDTVASREDVKREAQKSLRVEQRRLARATQAKDALK